jgi:protein TonB
MIPLRARRNNISGTVISEFLIKGGQVVEVSILSGPRVFDLAVVEALFKYECVKNPEVLVSRQEFNFLIEN